MPGFSEGTLPRAEPHAALLARLASFRGGDVAFREGRAWSLVDDVGESHEELLARAGELYLETHFLHPMAFQDG